MTDSNSSNWIRVADGLTDWDTTWDEQRFIGAVFDALFLKKNLALTTRLLIGIDETWFNDPQHRHLFLAVFEAATLAYDPENRVTATGVLDAAEKASGATGWARDVFSQCSERAGVFEPSKYLQEEAPLWWEKLKRKKLQTRLSRADQLLGLPPNLNTMQDVRDYLSAAIEIVDQEPTCSSPAANPMMESYRKFLEPLPADALIPTGMTGMDHILGGGLSGPGAPAGGKLIIITARPGMGKTQVAINLAMRTALQGYKTVMWSMEMQPEQIHARLFCALDFMECHKAGRTIGGKMTYSVVSSGQLSDFPQIKSRYVANEPQTQALADTFTVIPGTHTAKGITNTMRLFARDNPDTRLFVIDHLGLLDTGSNPNKAQTIGEATRLIKTTANELGIDVLLLSQLNRSLEQRQEKMPTLADLRDSGRIEEDADVVCGLLRPHYYDPEADPNELRVGILKNRQGRQGDFNVCIDNDACAIYEAFDSPL